MRDLDGKYRTIQATAVWPATTADGRMFLVFETADGDLGIEVPAEDLASLQSAVAALQAHAGRQGSA
jgi:tRNA threonylcarbamoyladenosine modification (KEOPS) complex  Pcc1 subunit